MGCENHKSRDMQLQDSYNIRNHKVFYRIHLPGVVPVVCFIFMFQFTSFT